MAKSKAKPAICAECSTAREEMFVRSDTGARICFDCMGRLRETISPDVTFRMLHGGFGSFEGITEEEAFGMLDENPFRRAAPANAARLFFCEAARHWMGRCARCGLDVSNASQTFLFRLKADRERVCSKCLDPTIDTTAIDAPLLVCPSSVRALKELADSEIFDVAPPAEWAERYESYRPTPDPRPGVHEVCIGCSREIRYLLFEPALACLRCAMSLRIVPGETLPISDPVPAPARRPESKVGRNDPCPCGSGKKFKKCHLN